MCTVTIIPKEGSNFILTSNRDEAPNRVSLPPDFFPINNTMLLFPKDETSGGSWIGASEKKRALCVLNGGFDLHERKAFYRLSRGVVAKDFMLCDDIEVQADRYNFQNIEPFTMVVADWNVELRFFELVWDGEVQHFKSLPLKPGIWSSSTLYTEEMKQERLQWFEEFKVSKPLDSDSIIEFHKTAGQGDKEYGVIMDRDFVKTTSITQIIKCDDSVSMVYENLQTHVVSNKRLKLTETVNE